MKIVFSKKTYIGGKSYVPQLCLDYPDAVWEVIQHDLPEGYLVVVEDKDDNDEPLILDNRYPTIYERKN